MNNTLVEKEEKEMNIYDEYTQADEIRAKMLCNKLEPAPTKEQEEQVMEGMRWVVMRQRQMYNDFLELLDILSRRMEQNDTYDEVSFDDLEYAAKLWFDGLIS